MVSANTLRTDIWTVLYTLLTDVTNGLTDPNAASRPTLVATDWVFSTFPDVTGSNFPGYPFVCIETPEAPGDPITMTQAVRDYDTGTDIIIYAKSKKNCKTLVDNVNQILNDYQSTAQTNGMMRFVLGDNGSDVDIINDVKVHTHELVAGYRYGE